MRRQSALIHFIAGGIALLGMGAGCLHAQDSEDMKRGVARISVMNGEVSVKRGDTGDWVAASVNAPVVALDHIATGNMSRAEVQLDTATFVRLGSNAEVNLAELQYQRAVLQLARGTSTVRVLRDGAGDLEVDTPNVSVRPRGRGVYRLTVRDNGESEITVRAGDVEIYTPRGSQALRAGQTMVARGTQADPEFQILAAAPYDDWDRWNDTRDQTLERSQTYRYVSRDIAGAEDLDPYGTWVYQAPYGYVWRPAVAIGWAPYQAGRWVWVDWYGWTWVSYDPWGWAPYHYGSWFWGVGGWCWYPGGFGRHYWSPAMVAWVGFGHGGGHGWGHVGWIALGPGERVSRWWGHGVSRNVYVTNNISISNTYRNARVAGGVTAVTATDFSAGRFGSYTRVNNTDLQQAHVVRGAVPAAPGDAHLRYSDRPATVQGRSTQTQFFAHRQPEQVQRASFNEQRQALAQVSQVPVATRSLQSPAQSSGAVRSTGRTMGQPAPAGRSTGEAGSIAQQRQQGSAGWRRFGEPASGSSSTGRSQSAQPAPAGRTPEASSQSRDTQRSNGSGSSNSNGGWRRFGDQSQPSATPQGTRGTEQRQPATQSNPSSRGWSRFGEPGSSSQGYSGRGQVQPNYQRPAPHYSSPAPQRQQPVRIAPPVVRERSSGGSSSSGGHSAPRGESSGGSRSGHR